MIRSEVAFTNMTESRMNCAQAVLSAFCEELGLDKVTAMRLARGFGGGMGRSGKTCGAVTGAYMVIGLLEPKSGREGIEAVYGRLQEFNRRFTEIYDSTECKELIGCDVSTAEGLAAARAQGLFVEACPAFVRAAVDLLGESISPGEVI